MYRTWLIPYLEDRLDAKERAELEARLADDPALAAEMSALRRTLPALRAGLAPHPAPEIPPLWPHLRERLVVTRRRQVRPLLCGWAVGTAVLALLLGLSAQDRHTMARRAGRGDARWRHELRRAPRAIFYRDNAPGTPIATRLERHARRVAAERRAAAFPPRAVSVSGNRQGTRNILTF